MGPGVIREGVVVVDIVVVVVDIVVVVVDNVVVIVVVVVVVYEVVVVGLGVVEVLIIGISGEAIDLISSFAFVTSVLLGVFFVKGF